MGILICVGVGMRGCWGCGDVGRCGGVGRCWGCWQVLACAGVGKEEQLDTGLGPDKRKDRIETQQM